MSGPERRKAKILLWGLTVAGACAVLTSVGGNYGVALSLALLGALCAYAVTGVRANTAALAELSVDQSWMVHQLNACERLRGMLGDEALSLPFGRMAIEADAAAQLATLIRETKPSLVVELGSGISTVVMAMAIKQNGAGQIVSFDHEAKYAARTRERIHAANLTKWANVLHAPLEEFRIGEHAFPWYQRAAFGELASASIDLLVVDGPPGWLHERARYPALEVLKGSLSRSAKIVVDDANRSAERAIAAEWAQHLGYQVIDLECRKGAVLLRRRVE